MSGKELTETEVQALERLAQGLTTTQVAKRLAMSESTLRRTVRRARAKLGAAGTTNAIYIAAKRGLI